MGDVDSSIRFDQIVDVVVVGTGAAGLVAATLAHDGGAEVVVLEKAPLIGGTTGVSGGMPWIPRNSHMAEVGVSDSKQEALTYLRRVTLGKEPDPALLEVYVDEAPAMLDYLESHTPLRMSAPTTFNDYYALFEGGKEAGRSIEPYPFTASELGADALRTRTSPHLPWLTMEEGARFLRGDAPPDFAVAMRRQQDDVRVLGPALVAALVKGLQERGVAILTDAPASNLVLDGRDVVGVRATIDGGSTAIGARRGVILCSGGFEWNREMVRAFINTEIEPLSPPQNEGDGHKMAMAAGAAFANMKEHWGQPSIFEPGFTLDGMSVLQMGSIRSAPGVIVVNKHAKRFVNEGATYQDYPKVIPAYDPVAVDFPNQTPHWAIFDQTVKDRAVVLPSVLPGQDAPEWIARADTIEALATTIGLDPASLASTIEEWNKSVANGQDVDFHRGTTRFETHMSGYLPSPAVVMAPVKDGPFYAVEIRNGTLGTSGGVRIDRNGQALDWEHRPIRGLYAAGNVSACVFGPAYPGGGATIGPAMTFGYLAGKHAAIQPPRSL